MSRVRVRRWTVGLVATLTLLSVGLLYASSTLLAGAAVPLAYVLYGSLSGLPEGASVRTARTFDRSDPAPGEAVGVELTVTNTGERVLPDVRVIDGVPDELAVTAGSPRGCVALPPGGSTTLTYEVVAKRGAYDFAEPAVRLRSTAGSERATAEVAAEGDRRLVGTNAVRELPVDDAALPRAGTLPTDAGGSGLEFHATREYRPGDSMTRVDWRHYAKTGEFVTVQYREERAARTVLVVDARPVGRVTGAPGYPTGAELAAYAGQRLYDALETAGVVPSVTAVGLETEGMDGLVGPDGLPWVDSDDRNRTAHAERLFRAAGQVGERGTAEEPPTTVVADGAGGASGTTGQPVAGAADNAGPDDPPDPDDELTNRLLARLPPNAQVVVCTPLVDGWPVEFCRTLSAREYPQVVLSPDVTGGRTVGQRVGSLRRGLRLRTLERTGATVAGWDLGQPIDHALRRSLPHLLR
ncbi:DUF58 domain-containing protein [Salinirussus salinus]|uniref:DUF58 domain-containing protein n=1 Tax=Salinirussus salinus TaxID=1198300 RepID=UPI00135737B0|nr:DUF58 domain-containing protein [Salinirussus salinus]